MAKIQEIFLKFGQEFNGSKNMSYDQIKVFNSITKCKTKTLGSHIYTCNSCGEVVYSYNSCRNRHCPNCGDFKKEMWIESHNSNILDVSYYHVVLAIPDKLHKVFYHNKKVCYDLLLKAASETILELVSNPKYLSVTPGIVSMLHTWNQTGSYHPHVHLIVTGGGKTYHGTWKNVDAFLPIELIEKYFKNKLILALKKANLLFYNEMEYLNDKDNLNVYLDNLLNITWLCYARCPFEKVESVYKYLAKYVYKVWITNEKIKKINDKTVVFEYKDSKDRSNIKYMKIKGEEFIRRYLLHVLPKNFMKIRYYGLFAGRDKHKRMAYLRIITRTRKSKDKLLSKIELLNKINGFDVTKCKRCQGKFTLIKVIIPEKPPDNKENKRLANYA